MKKTTYTKDKSKEKLQAIESALTQVNNFSANQQLKQKAISQEENSKKKKLPAK